MALAQGKHMFDIKPVSASEFSDRHIGYLERLPFAQELYIEWKINESAMFLLYIDGQIAGHFFMTKDAQLIEFNLDNQFYRYKDEAFHYIIRQKRIKAALVKTFDYFLLSCCNNQFRKMKAIGCLFRDCNPKTIIALDQNISTKTAENADYALLVAQNSGLYESQSELRGMIDNQQILMFYRGADLLGCGFCIQVHPSFNYYDIGMWVHPQFRKLGYAKQIIGHLKNQCLQKKRHPICGCAIENIGSRKTLQANGFSTLHNLLEYRF